MLKTPVLFLIFNRPDTTERVFEEIRKQKPQYLYVAADGARVDKTGESELCRKARDIIKNVDWECEVYTFYRESNLGCKKAVSEGITWFFDNVEEGIIIEDDCLPSGSFFKFCEENLEKYRHDTRIMHISGENPLNKSFGHASYFFSQIPHIWGWASWRRAWKLYDAEFQLKSQTFDCFIKNNLIANVFEQQEAQKYWNKIFLRVKSGEINTWDYQWTYALFVNNGLSIVPNKNMVSNIGFGNINATHTGENAKCADREVFEIDEITHPEFVLPLKEAVKAILKERYDIHDRTFSYILQREISRAARKLKK